MYKKKNHIHFIGIGGIGMSGIATILKNQGYHISGCDNDLEQKSIHDLLYLGCSIYSGNNTHECNDASIDILVYSSAIKIDNPEIIAAQKRGIPTISRALMLAELMRTKYSVAIAGAHGKTTTTSMISHILIEAQTDPTVIIGGHLKNISSNARFGKGDFLVAEADESDKSLLRLYPTIAVVTNIDLEHIDIYKDLDDIKNTFKKFLENIPFYGKAILCDDDHNIDALLPLITTKTIRYGFKDSSDIFAQDITLQKTFSACTIWKRGASQPLGALYVTMPGRHNLLNALAAITVCLELDIPFQVILSALANFKGIDRRFTLKGSYKGSLIFDDYGHHPTEIAQTLKVARKRTDGKLIVAFQPHRYSRTAGLWNDFMALFSQNNMIDHLIITDIYPASESPIANITSERLVTELKAKNPALSITYCPLDESFTSIKQSLSTKLDHGDLLLLQGAGKINTLVNYLEIQKED
ncbi:MAG: UDP-N-acetylmuramate--L-alanine ligase [Candidatus Babeliaceae bacterium]|nr:UDP-N-acetylmuramate--L-alanine ligase [Candidatus Babeliaceae bacterium]